ncbi:hypothetical protein PAMC26510_35975 [Caballeronia sordidicola]|uniref:Uncharacterized protein n=1 Tax=Caballeronia sordidicola TaxID=196367 RepID=A0A242M4V5_CABSO|nr:hypothetical protein PAMC26510_35975 [Caballeronia sordidicola]
MQSRRVWPEQLGGLINFGLPATEKKDMSTLGDEPLCDSQTDTGRSAANNGNLA